LSDSDDRIDVRGDGRIILYKREGLKHPKWQARIRVPNSSSYKIVTTKTGPSSTTASTTRLRRSSESAIPAASFSRRES
jgi:hypothetical protein